MKGQRLDERVVAEGLADNRTRARALIMSGSVLVDDVPCDKAGTVVKPEAAIRLKGTVRRFVSRGGEKLAGALEDLGVDPRGWSCLDIGASTGGFTDCLLQCGARGVIAVDVGTAQLHEKLRQDPRVEVFERTNARELSSEQVSRPVELVVADVSFISLELLLDPISQVAGGAELLLMVKPQFEVGRESVGKGGVVRDDVLREGAVDKVRDGAVARGYREVGRAESRLSGPRGNREVFLHLRRKEDADHSA